MINKYSVNVTEYTKKGMKIDLVSKAVDKRPSPIPVPHYSAAVIQRL